MTRPSSDPAAPEFGKIAVLSVPESAEVTLDANFVGNAPTEFRLPPGKHTFQVSARGYKKWTREITIVAGSEVHLKAELEKE
jgi:hypothetical protein